MREDFREVREELKEIGIRRIVEEHYMTPQRHGTIYFVKSPASPDKTASLAIFPETNRFCDFANGNKGGDVISLYAYVKGCSQWEALKALTQYYGLSDGRQDRRDVRRRIEKEEAEERKRAARKKAFYAALFGEIGQLKDKLRKYNLVLEKGEIEPFSDVWAYIQSEIQRVEYRRDILTAADTRTYRRMKPSQGHGLPSDRPEWLLDCLLILEESGAFEATEAEIRELTAQRAFESSRTPGRDRRCACEW